MFDGQPTKGQDGGKRLCGLFYVDERLLSFAGEGATGTLARSRFADIYLLFAPRRHDACEVNFPKIGESDWACLGCSLAEQWQPTEHCSRGPATNGS